MTVQVIDWDTAATVVESPTVRIWTKQLWQDAWTENFRLRCAQVNWSAGGSGDSNATLRYDLGRVFNDATQEVETRVAVNLVGYYVLIMVSGNDKAEPYDSGGDPSGDPYTTPNRFWLGFVEDQVLRDDGTADSIAYGHQTFICFSLDRALLHHTITGMQWNGQGDESRAAPVPFNSDGSRRIKNRTADRNGTAYEFEPDDSAVGAEFWSTKDIAEYLIVRQTPAGEDGTATVAFSFSDSGESPTYDKPVVETYGRTTASVLNDVLRPGRMLGWSFVPVISLDSDVPSVGTLCIEPYTLTESAITLGEESIAANGSQYQISASYDPLTEYTVETNGLETAQQVIVHGARRVTIATLGFGADDPLEPTWETGDKEAYNEGRSEHDDYDSQDSETKRRWNAEARNSPKLSHVFSRFRLKRDWDGADVFNTAIQQSEVGGDNDGDYTPFHLGLRILSRLPLKPGEDYTGDPSEIGEAATEDNDRDPLLVFAAPWGAADTYVSADGLSKTAHLQATRDGDDVDFSVDVNVGADHRSLWLTVRGGEPHEIAYADFERLDVDPVAEKASKYDYMDARITVAIEEDRYLEVREPLEFESNGENEYAEDAGYFGPDPGPASTTKHAGKLYEAKVGIPVPAGPFDASEWTETSAILDAVRTKLIRAGDSYESIWVADGTVTNLDEDGSLETLDKGFLVDDYPALQEVAKLAAAWYTRQRVALRVTTHRINGAIQLGSLITTFAGQQVNTTVNSITIDLPENGAATMTFSTWYGEIDPVGIMQDSGVV